MNIIKDKSLICLGIICLSLFCLKEAKSDNSRNEYLSPGLQKKYYKIKVQTESFLNSQRSDVNELIESSRGTSSYAYDVYSGAFVFGQGGVLDCQTFTYEGALGAITYLLLGKNSEAFRLLNVYKREFYRPKGDSIGLYTSYTSDIPEENGLRVGIDGDRVHLGPVMWISIACLQYTAMTGDNEFLGFVIDTVRWAQHLNKFVFKDGEKGPPSMGFGWGPDWSQVYSTENIVDYYAVLSLLKEIYRNGDLKKKNLFNRKNLGIKVIDEEMALVLRWIKEVGYDKDAGIFNRGYNANGPDRIRALDTVSWTIAALGPELLKQMGIDPFRLMAYAEKHFQVNVFMEGVNVTGFDFTEPGKRRNQRPMIWIEGTSQQIIAYQIISRYAKSIEKSENSREYRDKAKALTEDMDKIAEAVKLYDHALPYTSIRPKEKEIVMTFDGEWEIPRGNHGQWVGSLASTLWRYFAISGFNPLSFDNIDVTYRYNTGYQPK